MTMTYQGSPPQYTRPHVGNGVHLAVSCWVHQVHKVRSDLLQAAENIRAAHPEWSHDFAHNYHAHIDKGYNRTRVTLGPFYRIEIKNAIEQEYKHLSTQLPEPAKPLPETAPPKLTRKPLAEQEQAYLNGLAGQWKDRLCAQAKLPTSERGAFTCSGNFNSVTRRFELRVEFDHLSRFARTDVEQAIQNIDKNSGKHHRSVLCYKFGQEGWVSIQARSLDDLAHRISASTPDALPFQLGNPPASLAQRGVPGHRK